MNATDFAPLLMGILYLLPWLIAVKRRHRNRSAICALNLFLGWTFVGWVAALVWAYTDQRVEAQHG